MEKPYEEYVEQSRLSAHDRAVTQRWSGSLCVQQRFATQTMQVDVAESACDLIDVVPNPITGTAGMRPTGWTTGETFINLPQRCTISIYNVSGTLVWRYRKDNDLTFLDWDLKNESNVPIAGGVPHLPCGRARSVRACGEMVRCGPSGGPPELLMREQVT